MEPVVVTQVKPLKRIRVVPASRAGTFHSQTLRYAYNRRYGWHIVSGHARPVRRERSTKERLHILAMQTIGILAWIDILTMPLFIQRIVEPQFNELQHVAHSAAALFNWGNHTDTPEVTGHEVVAHDKP